MIDIRFKFWFTLKFEIQDFAGDVFDLCDVVPTDTCLHNRDIARLIVKKQPGMLTHLIEVNASGPDTDKPVYSPRNQLAFRYQLVPKTTSFSDNTNISTLDPNNYLVYLTNNADNKVGSILYTNKSSDAATNSDRVFRSSFSDVQVGALAVIDIFQNELIPADYRLQDVSGVCREPVYTVRFAKHP